jgi:hypothetical protein
MRLRKIFQKDQTNDNYLETKDKTSGREKCTKRIQTDEICTLLSTKNLKNFEMFATFSHLKHHNQYSESGSGGI